MKWLNNIFGILLVISLFACQNEDVKNEKEVGFLVLGIITDTKVTTKATGYDPLVIGIKILDASGALVKEYDDWETIQGDKIPLKAGSYTIIASSSGYDGNVGAEKPYYVGRQTVDIVMGEAANVDIVCMLANVKVSVKFSDNFVKTFGDMNKVVDGSLIIQSKDGVQKVEPSIADILSGKEGIYFFPVSDLDWNVVVRNQSSQIMLDYSGEVQEVKAREHIILNFKTKEDLSGKVDVELVVDETLQKYEYMISLPKSQGTGSNLITEDANAWTAFAKLSGMIASAEGVDQNAIVFKYREKGIAAWNTAVSAILEGSKYTAMLNDLTPSTTYEYCISDSKQDGNIVEFTTETMLSIPNNSFEDWWLNGKVWMPNADENHAFWDSGNAGAATLGTGSEVAYWESGSPYSGTKSAKLISRYVVIKFAAGNLFSGEYLATDGTDGVLSFGRSFNSRPSSLKGYLRYNRGTINRAPLSAYPNTPAEAKKNNPDKGKIYIALGDWEPQTISVGSKTYTAIVPIRTASKTQQLFNVNDSHIIAYGEKVLDSTVSDWTEFAVDLAYRSDRKPKYVVIVMTSSIYGDFFVGSDSSVLWVDDLSFDYPTSYASIVSK